jgi:hypothetical protein
MIVEIWRDPPEYSDEEAETDEEFETEGEADAAAGTKGEADAAAENEDTESDEDGHEGSEPYLHEAGDTRDQDERTAVQIFLNELDNWERIDNLISSLEVRRAAVLHELERQRSSWGHRLRRASDAALGGVEERKAPRIGKPTAFDGRS